MYKIQTVKEILKNTENGNHKFNVVSLFAGGGGSSTGYRMAGGKVLAVNEFIEEAQKTYAANYPNTYIFKQDVRQLNADDILKKIEMKRGELDILDGSPPCSAFSTAGSIAKSWGKKKKYSDSSQSNVEDLFFEYIRILRGIMPKIFIAENVSGLSKGASKGYLNEILRELKSSGYHVTCKLLNAKHLGVPQSRGRLIFIGIRNDLWKSEYKGNTHPRPQKNIITLGDALNGLEFTKKDEEETNIKKYAIYRELINMEPGEQSKKYFSLTKASRRSVCQCVTATSGCLSAAKSCHWDNRAFTVSETKIIMSIPDDYILTGGYSEKIERLGRMVAPLMMKAVAKNIYDLVLNENT